MDQVVRKYMFSRIVMKHNMTNVVEGYIRRDESRNNDYLVSYEIIDPRNDIREVYDDITRELYYKNLFQINATFSKTKPEKKVEIKLL